MNICTGIANLKDLLLWKICEDGVLNFVFCVYRRNLNYFSSAYTAAVSAVDPDAGHGELVIKIPSEIWKQGDGKLLLLLLDYLIRETVTLCHCLMLSLPYSNYRTDTND